MELCDKSPGSGQYVKVLRTLADLGHETAPGSKILDFGCGDGIGVAFMRERGFEGYGCDLRLRETEAIAVLAARGIVRPIATEPYRLPFDDGSFDVVFSCQVLEHVLDYRAALGEMKRVLRPRGVGLHIFPSRYRPVESHFHVPLAGVYHPYWYLLLWARLGIRSARQKGMSAEETARYNYTALRERTNYLPKRAISSYVSEFFSEYAFCELAAARYSRLGPVYSLVGKIPSVAAVLSAFQTRVLFFRKDPY